MITKPTVLIIGAGASHVYGFPTGQGLVSEIIHNLKPLAKNERRPNDWVRFLIKQFDIEEEEIYNFQKELHYSRISVDVFLEHRPEFIKVGKLSIALSIISHEQKPKLFTSNRNWMDYLREKLNAPFNEFGENKLSIISFNYDRSFEEYLFTVVKSTYGKSDEECTDQLIKIPIIHVHGRLGALPWQEGEDRPYDNRITPEAVKLASEQIIIMSEGQDTSSEFLGAAALLKTAHQGRIYFLGFGYSEVSLQRLKFGEVRRSTKYTFSGTAYGLAENDKNRLMSSWPIYLADENMDVLDFLRNSAPIE